MWRKCGFMFFYIDPKDSRAKLPKCFTNRLTAEIISGQTHTNHRIVFLFEFLSNEEDAYKIVRMA